MAEPKSKTDERTYTLSINTVIRNVTTKQAQEIEDAVRAVVDPYDEDVFVTKSNPPKV